MSDRLPIVSTDELIKILTIEGWETGWQKGSHIKLEKAGSLRPIIIKANQKRLSRRIITSSLSTAGISRTRYIELVGVI